MFIWALDPMIICDQHNHVRLVDHYKNDIISSVSHLRSDLVRLLVMDDSVQYPWHWYCITSPSGQCQPRREGVISRVDHTVKL
jgi:hypothetical protein